MSRTLISHAVLALILSIGAQAEELDIRKRVGEVLRTIHPGEGSVVALDHECDFRTTLACNAPRADTVDIYGCRTEDFNYFNMYRVFLNAGTTITVRAQMAGSTPLLVLFTDNATLLKSATAARNASAELVYTISASAYYIVTFGPVEDLDTGAYTISMTCQTGPVTSCVQNATTLCLAGNRFAVSVNWKTGAGTGSGTAVPLTSDTGYFWFFGSANVELMVKVLDGRPINGKFWVFYGALSNVEYTITVRDTQTGVTRTYMNASGNFGSVGDTNAF